VLVLAHLLRYGGGAISLPPFGERIGEGGQRASEATTFGSFGFRKNKTNKPVQYISLTGGNVVISLKGGIPKIWEETLLLLLLGIDLLHDTIIFWRLLKHTA
jgi:hypothetical protein